VKQTLKYLTALVCALTCTFAQARADETRPIGDEIVAFFDQQHAASSNIIRPTEVDSAIVELLTEVSESLFTADHERLATAISVAEGITFIDRPAWRRAVVFAQEIGDIIDTSPPENRSEVLLEYLDGFNADDDWYLHSISKSIAAYFYVSNNQILIGTERLDSAMAVIPSELSAKVTGARILASGVAMIWHGLQGNTEFMLDAARIQSKAKAMIGEEINRHELMTNFIFALNRARQYKAAAQVAELLIKEPVPADSIVGLSEAYMAATFNELNNFVRAETLARAALTNFDHPVVEQRGGLELLISLSGLGKKDEAEALMVERNWNHSPADLLSTVTNQSILHAEALLAVHRDEAPYAVALMKRRADILINQVQSENSTDISGMLSNLENTRERQLEREGALQREAELKAVQLEQKTNLNRLLWVLIAGLTLAFNFLLAFLRYREKLNVKVQGLQEDALSAEKMKTEFLGIINHELRTPLNGIIGISDAMIHHASSPIMREQAEAVQQSGQLLFDLLDSLITMSTIEGGRLSLDNEKASLAKTISNEIDDWETVATSKGLVFTHFIASELQDPVIGDHKRIRQSLRYLLSNAVRFTHEGRVHLHATAAPDATGHLAVTIVVADTGQGISEDVQSRLFTPFLQADATMTRKYGGAGLSLAIARKLARMMDGDLVVNSREGRGTEFTFTVRLPLTETTAQTRQGNTNVPKKLTVPALDGLDDPTEIIDLMLGEQLGGNGRRDREEPRRKRFKTAG
jgi:signal transduction histidine kinase